MHATSWTGPFWGVGMIQTVPLFLKHVAPSTKQDCCGLGEVLLGGRTYQMESDVSCLIGTSAPALGCSRPPWVGWVVLRGWHGAWGNLKEKKKKPVRSGVSQAGVSSCAPCLLEEQPAAGGQTGWENLFPWQPEKAIPKVVLQPSSPLGSSLELGVRGTDDGICVGPTWTPNS